MASWRRVLPLLGLLLANSEGLTATLRQSDAGPGVDARYCTVFPRGASYREYLNPQEVSNPSIGQLEESRNVEPENALSLWLQLDAEQCRKFTDQYSEDRFFSSDGYHWYEKSDFIHESALIPIDRWTTRYIYINNNAGATPDDALIDGYAAYSLQQVRRGLLQFSDDGYYLDAGTRIRWRIMRHPYLTPDDPGQAYSRLIAIDESGRYLARALPVVGDYMSYDYVYHCTRNADRQFLCGFGRDPTAETQELSNYGHISRFTKQLSPVRVDPDRITITRRISYDEPFIDHDAGSAGVAELFFYANFSDPVRPVYFASGLLLKDVDSLKRRPQPTPDDFVKHEVCLTDCPSEVSWQYASRSRPNESHP